MAGTRHHQAGYVFRKGSNWYVRYREDVQLENRSVQRIPLDVDRNFLVELFNPNVTR